MAMAMAMDMDMDMDKDGDKDKKCYPMLMLIYPCYAKARISS
jgi:hypothetical protein